jgi:hypothetical protein
MARWLFVLLVCIVATGSACAWFVWRANPFSNDKLFVTAYAMNEGLPDTSAQILSDSGEINPTVRPLNGVALTQVQVRKLRAALHFSAQKSLSTTMCFIPHHGFVFRDSEGNILAHLSVCFECLNMRSSPERWLVNDADFHELQELTNELGLSVSGGRKI